MRGLLLHLLEDSAGSPGRWFWPCFEPLRPAFDERFWVVDSQPWMGAPLDFDFERDTADYEGSAGMGISLWRPGAIGRWADQICEESIELWAPPPDADPPRLASAYARTSAERTNDFVQRHADLWLTYTDSTCWEIFARPPGLLDAVRTRLSGSPSVRVYETRTDDRARAFTRAGLPRP